MNKRWKDVFKRKDRVVYIDTLCNIRTESDHLQNDYEFGDDVLYTHLTQFLYNYDEELTYDAD